MTMGPGDGGFYVLADHESRSFDLEPSTADGTVAVVYPGPDSQPRLVVRTVTKQRAVSLGGPHGVAATTATWVAGGELLNAVSLMEPADRRGMSRRDWLQTQTEAAVQLADELGGPRWSVAQLAVDGKPSRCRITSPDQGIWVAVVDLPDVFVGMHAHGFNVGDISLKRVVAH